MSHKRYAFINSDGIVVQVIIGTLDAAAQAQFLRDYAALFGAVAIIEVYADTPVWIGGTYADGEFNPPPQPEIIDSTSEVIEEPVAMLGEPQPEPLPEPEPEA
jgi:hypothetical protein